MKAMVIDVQTVLDNLSRKEGVHVDPVVMESWVAREYGRRYSKPCISISLLTDLGRDGNNPFEQLKLAQHLDSLGYDLIGSLPAPREFDGHRIEGVKQTFGVMLGKDGFLVIGDVNEIERRRRNLHS